VQIAKVAICTDSTVGTLLEAIGRHFTHVDVRKFDFDDEDGAEKWILA